MSASNYVHLEVDEIMAETEKAFRVRIGDEEYWLPFSQIADSDDYQAGDKNCTMSVTEWIAKEKGLIE